MADSLTSDVRGARFGKYRIVRKLGEGAFGAVYEAVLPGLHGFAKRVAVKKLRASVVANDPAFVQSMVNEARIGGLLHHGNIVDVFEFEQVDEHYYLAMEFVEGLTLDEIVHICRHNETLLPRFATLKIGTDVCRGLHYAHQFRDVDGQPLNLVHRDLKPSNIIVNVEGTAKILDFGIAKAASNLYNTTSTSVSKGTPRYMSPEQMMAEGPLTHRSDIFSMGAVLFEVITGRVLFDAPSLPALALKIVGEVPQEDLDDAETALPGSGDVLRRALERRPEDRFEDAQDMANALLALSHKYPAQADMAEVVSRLLPSRDLSASQVIVNSAELNLATHATTDGVLPPLSEQRHIPPPSPSSAGWDRFTEVFDTVATASNGPDTGMFGGEDEATRALQGMRQAVEERDDATAQEVPGLAGLDSTGSTPPPSRKWLWGVAVVVLLALAVGVGVMVGRQPPAEPAGEEPTAAVTNETEPEAVTAPIPPPGEVEPVTEAVPVEPDVTPAPVEEVTAAPEPETPPPPAPEARPGKVSIRCKPWSQIFVDGTLVKESVILKDHDVAGGRHEIRLVCPDHGNAEKVFSVDIDGQNVGLGCWDFTADAPCGG